MLKKIKSAVIDKKSIDIEIRFTVGESEIKFADTSCLKYTDYGYEDINEGETKKQIVKTIMQRAVKNLKNDLGFVKIRGKIKNDKITRGVKSVGHDDRRNVGKLNHK